MNIRGNKGSAWIAVLVFLGILALGAVFAVGSYVSAANYGNEAEQRLEAKWQDNQNVLGQYTIKIGEMAQVPEIARDDLKEVLKATFEGRYGSEGVSRGAGEQKTFQWLQEQNPNLNPELYNRLQQTMEAGRNEFKVSQTELLDEKRAYQTNLGYVWKGFWMKLAGYPKVDLSKYKVVVGADTAQKFETGVDTGVKLR
ncbi:hypothetical protein [Xanthomonas phage X1]|nr:hypothetical protein [Xanthomonas phage X1]